MFKTSQDRRSRGVGDKSFEDRPRVDPSRHPGAQPSKSDLKNAKIKPKPKLQDPH